MIDKPENDREAAGRQENAYNDEEFAKSAQCSNRP